MDAFIIAGGIPQPGEPLYPLTQGRPKALLELAGRSMIQWVVDALDGARLVERIAVVGLDADVGLRSRKPLTRHPGGAGFFENAMAGREVLHALDPGARLGLIVSSDVPALTPDSVDWLAAQTQDADYEVTYVVVRKDVMEAAFPGSGRSYLHMGGLELCGGSVHVVDVRKEPDEDDVWKRLGAARKSAFRQALVFGIGFLLRVALRRVTLEQAERHIARRLGLKGRMLVTPYAELGMDVDKPHQLELLRAHLSRRAAGRNRA
jgi:GTP:adenosylcobinamide-phosphate guanylyltransferase